MRVLQCLITVAILSTPAMADVWSFETPSENIQCSVGQEADFSDISCTIIERSGPPALPRPANCAAGWGHVFSMGDRGPVEMMCALTSRDKGAQERAEYGVTGSFGGITCHSSRKGLQCTNRDGHGFFLSRRRQSVF